MLDLRWRSPVSGSILSTWDRIILYVPITAEVLNISQEPRNFVSYIYNLAEANMTPNRRPRWFRLYDMRSAFGLRDLSPTSMDALVRTMATERSRNLIGLYSKFLLKQSVRRWPYCGDWCKIENLCRSVVTVLWRRERCEELRRLFWR